MKRILLILFFVIPQAWASPQHDFQAIDEHARNAPASVTGNIEELAAYLVKPATNDVEKVRSFYVWIAENISYDVQAFLKGVMLQYSPEEVLQKRKAVCQGYSGLFKALCEAVGIECKLIAGYSKGYGYVPKKSFTNSDHAWNAVYLNNRWHLLDVTWGAGGINDKQKFVKEFNEAYFLTDPVTFVFKHLPLDPMWQLLDCPVSIQDFAKGDEAVAAALKGGKKCMDYEKAIADFEKLSAAEQELQTAKNAYAFNPDNPVALATAYVNYAYYLTKDVKQQLTSKQEILDAIQLQEETLTYLKTAEDLLKKSNDPHAQGLKTVVQQNISNGERNLKAMKEVVSR
jgi:transglutaminase/protease-like cytokinesis protein 3